MGRVGRQIRRASVVVLVLTLVAGCGSGGFPADARGARERIQTSKVMRVGVSHNPPWVVLDGDADPTGSEPELLTRYAEHLGARVEWTAGSEEGLVADLESGDLDAVAAGVTAKTPWAAEVATTRPYRTITDADGGKQAHVLLVTPGENALLTDLERWLDANGAA